MSILEKNGFMFKRKDKSELVLTNFGNASVMSAGSTAPERIFSRLLVATLAQSNRWFLMAPVLGLIECIALKSLFSLSKPMPYTVKMNDANDEIATHPLAAREVKAQNKYIAAEARALVLRLMALDSSTAHRDLDRATSHMTGKAMAEFREFLTLERTFERLEKATGLVQTTEISRVDTSQDNIVFVLAQTSERMATEQPIITTWRFTLDHVIEPAIDKKGILENPLGFVVTHFERVQDTIR